MKRMQGLGVLALMALSATAGWVLLMPQAPQHTPVVVAAPSAGAAAQALSVMAWPRPAAEALGDAASPVRPAHPGRVQAPRPVAEPEDGPDAAGLARQLRDGGEAQREAVLLQARTEGVPLPEALLRQVMSTDASGRVRMAAFEAWVELNSGSVEELRDALQVALALRDTALQTRAREQLDALERMQQEEAALQQQQP